MPNNKKSPIESAVQDVQHAEAQLEEAQAEVVTAHRERAEAAQAQAEQGQSAVIEDQIAVLREAGSDTTPRSGYTVNAWAGKPHYVSNDGRFDTFDEEAIKAFVQSQRG